MRAGEARAAARLCEAARLVAPAFALAELTREDLRALLAECRIALTEHPISVRSWFVRPLPDRTGVLHLCTEAQHAPALLTFLVLRVVGRYWPADDPRDVTAADVFALAGTLHRAGWEAGWGWVAERLGEIEARDEVWEVAPPDELLPLAEKVLARVSPRQRTPEERAPLAAAAAAAYEEGRAARRENDYETAVERFRVAARLAQRAEDWDCRVRAIGSLGVTYRLRGNYPRAKRTLMRALSEVRRHEVQQLEGIICHELFTLAGEILDESSAMRWAREAHQAYPTDHPRRKWLSHDVAVFWTVTGDCMRALPIFREIRATLHDPGDRRRVAANIARTAGGAQFLAEFDHAASEVAALLWVQEAEEEMASCLLAVAYGARSLCLWDRATTAATAAWREAIRTKQARVRLEAEALLDSLHPIAMNGSDEEGIGDRAKNRRASLAQELLTALRERG